MNIRKLLPTVSAAVLVVASAVASHAQDGPLRRAGRALDNTGKNIRARVEGEVVKGEIRADERDLLSRVHNRIRWDKRLATSVLQIEVQADGSVFLRGSVADEAAKNRAVDLAESTVGVTKVIDELAIGKEVRVITTPATTIVVPGETKVVVPVETKVVVPVQTKPIPKF